MSRTAIGNPKRIVFLDEMRGLCIILMIIYHGLYDLVYLFGVKIPFRSPPLDALQLFICVNFILISGISSRYSGNNLRRGGIVFLIGIGMSLATWLLMPGQMVLFGILHCLGLCMIIYGLLHRVEKSGLISPFAGMLGCLLLFAVTWGIPQGYLGFFGFAVLNLPKVLYSFYVAFPLGFQTASFFSSDYFPLLPWAFLFFAGSYLGVAFREGSMPIFFYKARFRFLRLIGKHTLVIYVAHQPVLYGLLSLVFMGLRGIGLAA